MFTIRVVFKMIQSISVFTDSLNNLRDFIFFSFCFFAIEITCLHEAKLITFISMNNMLFFHKNMTMTYEIG